MGVQATITGLLPGHPHRRVAITTERRHRACAIPGYEHLTALVGSASQAPTCIGMTPSPCRRPAPYPHLILSAAKDSAPPCFEQQGHSPRTYVQFSKYPPKVSHFCPLKLSLLVKGGETLERFREALQRDDPGTPGWWLGIANPAHRSGPGARHPWQARGVPDESRRS